MSVMLLTLQLSARVRAFKGLLLYFIFPGIETANKVLEYGFVGGGNIYNLIKVQQENYGLKTQNDQLIIWKSEYENVFEENIRLRDIIQKRWQR